MNEIRIGIVYEPRMKQTAIELKHLLDKRDFTLEFYTRDNFPTGDVMILFLSSLSKKFAITLLLISNHSNGYFWISKELKVQQLLKNCLNIYPVFLTQKDIPIWWQDEPQKYITVDNFNLDILS